MKPFIVFLAVIYMSVYISATAHISHKDVKLAKQKYKHETNPDLRATDSLGWREYKAIRHDQHIPLFLRRR